MKSFPMWSQPWVDEARGKKEGEGKKIPGHVEGRDEYWIKGGATEGKTS